MVMIYRNFFLMYDRYPYHIYPNSFLYIYTMKYYLSIKDEIMHGSTWINLKSVKSWVKLEEGG